MGLLKAFAREVQSAKLSSRQMPTNPSRVAAAVNDGVNESCFMRNRVINREGKLFGQQPVKVFMWLQVDAGKKRQRINIGINVFEKIFAQSGLLRLVKMKTVEDVQFGKIENFNIHAPAWRSAVSPSPNLQNAPCPRAPAVRARRAHPCAIAGRGCFARRGTGRSREFPTREVFPPRSFLPMADQRSCDKFNQCRRKRKNNFLNSGFWLLASVFSVHGKSRPAPRTLSDAASPQRTHRRQNRRH